MTSLSNKIKKGTHILHSVMVAPKPEDLFFLTFAITYRCGSRCTMCNIWKKYDEAPSKMQEELSIEEIRHLFQSSEYLKGIRFLIIGGGEPFLKEDFVDIILFFYELNPDLTIVIATNGQNPTLIESKLRAIRFAMNERGLSGNFLNLGLSLDGMENTHDTLRGIKGAYKKVIDSAQRIKRIEGVRFGFSFTVTPQNYKEFSKVFELSKQLGIIFSFQFAHKSSHYYGNEEKEFKWTQENLDEMKDIMCQTGHIRDISNTTLKYRVLNIDCFFNERLFDYLNKPKRYFNCYSGTHSCFVDPHGNVFPCIMLDKSFGNIRNKNFDQLWKSSEVNNIRKYISKWKCHCYSFCDIPNSLGRNIRVNLWNLKKIIFGQHINR